MNFVHSVRLVGRAKRVAPALVALVLGAALSTNAFAQGRAAAPPPPANGKAGAPIDITGNWVSLVSDDWVYRMITPAKGDYQYVPLNP